MASNTAFTRDAAFTDAALSHGAAASGRQRPEEILAQTLTAPPHPEATDGWSSRGRRLFLIALGVAGVLLVVAGLLVTKELAPGTGNPTPLLTGPGNGLANQLLQSTGGDQAPAPAGQPTLNVPLPTTPPNRPARASDQPSAQVITPSPSQSIGDTTNTTSPPTTTPHPTTTLPCGLLGQGLQSAQLPVCQSSTRSTL